MDSAQHFLVNILNITRNINHLLDDSTIQPNRPATAHGHPPPAPSLSSQSSDLALLSLRLPQSLTVELIAIGLQVYVAKSLSRSFTQAATRLKKLLEASCRRVFQRCIETSHRHGQSLPKDFRIQGFYEAHFETTIASWTEASMLRTRQFLMASAFKAKIKLECPRQKGLPPMEDRRLHTCRDGFLPWSTPQSHSFKVCWLITTSVSLPHCSGLLRQSCPRQTRKELSSLKTALSPSCPQLSHPFFPASMPLKRIPKLYYA